MPAVLTDSLLADPCVPASWLPVLEDLRRFVDRSCELRALDRPVSADEQAELVRLHDQLVFRSADLLEPGALADLPREVIARLLGRAVLVLVQLKQAVLSAEPVFDTAGSRTLGLFEADFYQAPENVQRLLDRSCSVLSLTPGALDTLAAELNRDLCDALRKQAIVRALREEFNLWPRNDDLRESIGRFFQAIYPAAPVAADEIELIVTGTLVFFCLPLGKDADALVTERYERLDASGKAQVQQFLRKLKRFAQERFASFPAFGLVERGGLDAALVERLAQRSGLSSTAVLDELPRLITILPQGEIDKYLIHDVWGHGWQASMLRFDDLYEEIATYDDSLDLAEDAQSAWDDGHRLSDCFVDTGDAFALDAERFRAFAMAEVCQRLPVSLSAVLAEMMADVAEYKFLAEHPELAHLLPSSSLLSIYPSMLDLTLTDIPFYFNQATKVFRLWAKQPARQERLAAQLVSAGAAPADAAAAVQQAVALWRELESDYFRPELAWQADGDRLRVNAYTRIALNFVGLHRAVLNTYREISAMPSTGLPLKSFRDLLVIAASVFFESSPARNLWRVDEFLTLVFVPFCRSLCAASDR